MSLILNIETATTVCSVALSGNGKLISFREMNSGYTHAENLTLFIQDILTEGKIALKNIDAVSVSKGPGSYTGLRIGVSTAKAICYTLNKPLIAIDTLQALAMSQDMAKFIPITIGTQKLLCPMIDARRMEVYCGLYSAGGKEIMPAAAKIIDEHSFSEELKKGKIIFFGDGAEKCKSFLSRHTNAIFVDSIFPSAKNMCSLSHDAFGKKQFENTAYFEPAYLKEFISSGTKTYS